MFRSHVCIWVQDWRSTLVCIPTATTPVFYQWTAANVAGHTKRPFAMGLIPASFALGNIIGPQTFRAKDAPYYTPAAITVLATQAAGALVAVVLFVYHRLVNAHRDRHGRHDETNVSELDEKWGNLTDKENPSFRYVY